MLTIVIGVTVFLLGLVCWIGQAMAVFFLPKAIQLGLFEPEREVDQSMYLFERMSQGVMDVLLTWILPLSALMLVLGQPNWPLFALVGGGVYLYFPGVFMITRIVLKKHGRKVGRPSSVTLANVLGVLWTLSAIAMISLAVAELGV